MFASYDLHRTSSGQYFLSLLSEQNRRTFFSVFCVMSVHAVFTPEVDL